MNPQFNAQARLKLSILAIPLAVVVNTFFPLNQNPSIASQDPLKISEKISQTNEPETAPDATVVPVNGTVNVKFTNTTNARILYQAVGQTSRRTLAAQSTVTLQKLKLPASILFRRQDEGFLKVTLNPVSDGTVEVKLEETTDLGADQQSLSIRDDGALFLR